MYLAIGVTARPVLPAAVWAALVVGLR